MFSKRRIALLTLIVLLCGISIVGILADLNFNLNPTATCPDDGETFTRNVWRNSQEVFAERWEPPRPSYAQTHLESTVTGFGLVVLKFNGTVAGYNGTASKNGSVGSWGTFLGFPTSRSVSTHPVAGTVMEIFPTADGTHNWSGNGSIKLTPMIWLPSSSGGTWGGSWSKGSSLTLNDMGWGSWTIKTVYH